MKINLSFILCILLISCKKTTVKKEFNQQVQSQSKVVSQTPADFTITFGSCNKPTKKNIFWDDIIALKPNVWIWGGDIVYADTNNMEKMKADYNLQKQQEGYSEVEKNMRVLGTWDDHDYGKNDAGVEYEKKKESQQLFLDFLNVDTDSPRRQQEGVYHTETFTTPKGSVKIIILDTRYFRTKLTRATNGKRYQPNKIGQGTVLGKAQWKWLNQELTTSKADFNIIMSSIQVISDKHGFEKWGNFPHERQQLFDIIKTSKAKNVILLSGDRHISEFSKIDLPNVNYPIIDFTSSGLTHAYTSFKKEHNPYRTGKVISNESFGVVKINFKNRQVTMQMQGDNSKTQQEFIQVYP